MYVIAETLLFAAIVCGDHRKAEDRMISASSNAHKYFVAGPAPSLALIPAGDVEKAIRDDFGTIPEIKDIQIFHESGEIIVRLIANDLPKELRYRIYDKQADIIRAFPEVDLDFSLIPVS